MSLIKHVQEIVAIPSVTGAEPKEGMPYGEHVHAALMYALDLCEEFGFRTKNCDNQVGYGEIGEGEEMIGILCHLDVVPEGSGWIHPPYGGEIHDGKIYGRGTSDDKGPAIAAVYAMKELLDSGVKLNKRIRIIFGSQEESGGWTDMAFYKETEEMPTIGFTPDAEFPVIYCESGIMRLEISMPYDKAGFISVEGGNAPNMVPDFAKCTLMTTKGQEAHLEMKGVSAHGSVPWEGENAITKLMEKVVESNKAGLTSCVFADFYMDKIGYALHGEQLNKVYEDEESGKISYNVGVISALEDKVVIKIDIRHPISFTPEEIAEHVTKEVEGYGVTVKVAGKNKFKYMDKESDLIKTLVGAFQEVTGDMTEPIAIAGGTYARLMDGIVAYGPLFPGRESTVHQPNEYIYVDELEKAKDIYALALKNMLAI